MVGARRLSSIQRLPMVDARAIAELGDICGKIVRKFQY